MGRKKSDIPVADRVREYRARQAAEGIKRITIALSAEEYACVRFYAGVNGVSMSAYVVRLVVADDVNQRNHT